MGFPHPNEEVKKLLKEKLELKARLSKIEKNPVLQEWDNNVKEWFDGRAAKKFDYEGVLFTYSAYSYPRLAQKTKDFMKRFPQFVSEHPEEFTETHIKKIAMKVLSPKPTVEDLDDDYSWLKLDQKKIRDNTHPA